MELSDILGRNGKQFLVFKHRLYVPTLGERTWNYKTHLLDQHRRIVSASPDIEDQHEFLSFFEVYENSNYTVVNDPNNPVEKDLLYRIRQTVDADITPTQREYARCVAETDRFDLAVMQLKMRDAYPNFGRRT